MNTKKDGLSTSFSPTICVTHSCNLSCVYCYQRNKSVDSMSFQTGKKCIDDIFLNIPENTKNIEISFIGGEPLLKMDLIKELFDYTMNNYHDKRIHFFATTNGTTLSLEDKAWFTKHKDKFILGLSLDGTKETHDYNRSNSFDLIDIPFFLENWPFQGPKMTISMKTLEHLADNIIYIHELGFKEINGVNFAEGEFEWLKREELGKLSKQLKQLLDYYSEDFDIKLDQMFGKHIEFCASLGERYKTCGIGTRTIFYDVDGKKYPCSFVTPLTFSEDDLNEIKKLDFCDSRLFLDEYCNDNCILYPICGTCSGANYLVNGAFSQRNKSRCDMYKIISIYIAEYHIRKIMTCPEKYEDDNQVYFLIEAIKKIRDSFYNDYKDVLYFSD